MFLHLLVLCLYMITWGNSSAVKPYKTQPLDCSKLERLRDIHEQERFHARGDKFDDFDWQLSKEVNAEEKGNIVISPISLKVVLAMLYEGAKGQTAGEIGDALDLVNTTSGIRLITRERFSAILQSLQTSEGEYKIKIGTHVFIDKNAEPKPFYQCKLRMYYNSDMERVDFSDSATAVKEINNWARNVTEGHIQHLISEAEAQSSTIMLLLNAVYFKGLWEIPFPENQTAPGLFYLNDKETVKVPLMNTTDKFGYHSITNLNAQLVRLPYLGSKFAMYVLLPNIKTGLNALVQTLGPDMSLDGYIANMTFTSINLIMPKFEFEFTTSLRPTLEKLGIKTMFTTNAELSDIAQTRTGSLVVSNVLQKSGISVTELGTVAYAATVADLMDKFGGTEEPIEFKADRPFLFFIRDESVKTSVFVGKVTNPEKAKVVSRPQETPTGGKPCVGTDCGTNNGDRIGDEDNDSQAKFNFFDADLLKEIGKGENDSFVISPASVKTLLGMIMKGAEGSTLTEIQNLLRLPKNSTEAHSVLSALHTVTQKSINSSVTIDLLTKIFVAKGLLLNTSYTKAVNDLYKAEAINLDFSSPEVAAHNINSWVTSRTRGLITNLIEPDMIDPESLTILTSAIYFDGKWKEEFQLKDTKEECFYSEPNLRCQKVPMMYKTDELLHKFDNNFNSHILQIPYQDDRFSMVLVVPLKRDGMEQLALDAHRLTLPGLLHKMGMREVNLKLPRFTINYGADLTHTLIKMGLNEVFSERAQLPFMVNNSQGQVSAIVHRAKIEVTEKGTKAAAASGASVVPLMFGLEVVNVTADHPFYYFIYEHESQSVLFVGRLSSINDSSMDELPLENIPLASNSTGNPSNIPTSSADKPSHVPFSSRPTSSADKPSNVPFSSRPNIIGTQNHPYVPAPIPTRRYTDPKDQIHFPSTGNSSVNRNYLKYLQQNNKPTK